MAASPSLPSPAPFAIVAASFWLAVHRLGDLPAAVGPELAFAGRSNVGKSSLMNLLLGRRRLVRTSATPGCTRALGFFRARARDGVELTLVDLPGYGYAKRSKQEREAWAGLAEAYLGTRAALRAVVVLVDARHGATADDERLLAFVRARSAGELAAIVVATKLDKVPRSQQRATLQRLTRLVGGPVVGASAITGEGAAALWQRLRAALGPPP